MMKPSIYTRLLILTVGFALIINAISIARHFYNQQSLRQSIALSEADVDIVGGSRSHLSSSVRLLVEIPDQDQACHNCVEIPIDINLAHALIAVDCKNPSGYWLQLGMDRARGEARLNAYKRKTGNDADYSYWGAGTGVYLIAHAQTETQLDTQLAAIALAPDASIRVKGQVELADYRCEELRKWVSARELKETTAQPADQYWRKDDVDGQKAAADEQGESVESAVRPQMLRVSLTELKNLQMPDHYQDDAGGLRLNQGRLGTWFLTQSPH